MAKKGNRVQVILECTEHKTSGMPGTSRYITTKNRKNTTERMELKKYNPILRQDDRSQRDQVSHGKEGSCNPEERRMRRCSPRSSA
jgi:large subunit ribosomal protein L33